MSLRYEIARKVMIRKATAKPPHHLKMTRSGA